MHRKTDSIRVYRCPVGFSWLEAQRRFFAPSLPIALTLVSLSHPIFAQQSNSPAFQPPQHRPESRYLKIWENSPFELEAAPEPVIAQTTQSQEDFTLAGVIKKGEEYVVYIQNRRTSEVSKATRTPGSSEFIVKQVTPGDSGEYAAVVEYRGRTLTLTYDRQAMTTSRPPPQPSSTSTSSADSPSPQADFNPAQLALEKARKEAAARNQRNQSSAKAKGEANQAQSEGSRRRTIFVPDN